MASAEPGPVPVSQRPCSGAWPAPGQRRSAMAIKPATTPGRPMSETAYRMLRERVMTCKLTPGARLTERGTAAELGLGLSPVRHALTRLVQDGLGRLTPPEGHRGAPLPVRSVDDLFNVWLLLGPEIARLGVTQAAPEQAAELRRLATEGSRTLTQPPGMDNTAQFIALADSMFHLLAVAAGNDRLRESCLSPAGEMTRVWTLVLTADPVHDVLLAVTEDWRPAIDHRDGDRAARL